MKPLCVPLWKPFVSFVVKKEINHKEHKGFHKEHKEKTIKMKKSRQNGFKTQIMLPKAMPLGWVMLPFQGENGFGRFLTQGDAIGLIYAAQGDAIGLGYSAPSGRRRIGVFHAQGDAIGLRYSALSGRKWFADLSALKGQYNPVQRQRLG